MKKKPPEQVNFYHIQAIKYPVMNQSIEVKRIPITNSPCLEASEFCPILKRILIWNPPEA
jgi:hypothetical protein